MSNNIVLHKEVTLIPYDQLTLNDWNPNFVPEQMYAAIKDDIVRNGFIGTIAVQKHNKHMNKDNVVINGEHRAKILHELGQNQIPSTVLDIDDNTAKALTLRLNREHGELDPNKIGILLESLSVDGNMQDIDALSELTALSEKDIELYKAIRLHDEDLDAAFEELGNPAPLEGTDSDKQYVDWAEIEKCVKTVCKGYKKGQFDAVIGIANGGFVPARLVARQLDIDKIHTAYLDKEPSALGVYPPLAADKKYLVVDDILDTKKTYTEVKTQLEAFDVNADYAFLITRWPLKDMGANIGRILNHDKWIVFPWEEHR